MVEYGSGPRSGTRDNGLRCASYVAAGDLDPRVADAVLAALRDDGIAAYAAPTPGERGGYLEVRLPSHRTDRLYVDEDHAARAAELIAAEPAPTPEPDFDTAWQQVLVSLQTTATDPVPPWPVTEDVDEPDPDHPAALVAAADFPPDAAGPPIEIEEHFVPPPAPPLPKLRRVTVIAWLAIAAGMLVLFTGVDGGDLGWLGVLAIVGGAATLVWHVRQGPPTDSGWDDGAVV